MKTISGIEFASEHNGTDVFRVIELAYEQGRKDGHSEQLGTNLAEVGTDCISRQAAITALTFAKETGNMKCGELKGVIEVLNRLSSAEPELIKCDYVKACNKVTMNKTFSAWRYLAMLDDFEELGYILVKRRDNE